MLTQIFQPSSTLVQNTNMYTNIAQRMYSGRSMIRTFRRNGKKFVIPRVRYMECLHKGLLSKGEQALIRYIESLYYRGFVLSSICCMSNIYYSEYSFNANLDCPFQIWGRYKVWLLLLQMLFKVDKPIILEYNFKIL